MNMRRRLAAMCAALIAAALWIACSDDRGPAPLSNEPIWCDRVDDCPSRIPGGCGEWSCVKGECQHTPFAYSTSQRRGDCEFVLCTLGGNPLPQVDTTDTWDDGNPCTDDICVDGNSANEPSPRGDAPSGRGFCDGHAHRVDCLADVNCDDPALYCSSLGKCIPLVCKNGTLDADAGESSVDCGGRCEPCGATLPCNDGDDCASHICGSDKACAPVSCDDGVENGDETDLDCGAHCRPCPDTAKCREPGDCVNQVCWAGKCKGQDCRDGVRNGHEHDVDCGGECPPCP